MLRKRKGFTALLEFMTSLIVVFIAAGAISITIGINKENYANQLVASLEMISSKTRMSNNVLDAYGMGNVLTAMRNEAKQSFPDMNISCSNNNTTGQMQSCKITYKIFMIPKSKTINFDTSYIDGGKLLGG